MALGGIDQDKLRVAWEWGTLGPLDLVTDVRWIARDCHLKRGGEDNCNRNESADVTLSTKDRAK